MKSRCYYCKSKHYSNYGGRGIIVCNEWLHNFQAFYDWAMSNGYKESLTLDRIDTNGNYEPSNCRWIANNQQQNNKLNNHYITYKGETRTAAEWAKQYGLHRCVLNNRLRRGWSFEKAVNRKVGAYTKRDTRETI